MAFEDLSDDDFVEIKRFEAKSSLDLTMRCVRLGRQQTRRVQFTFRPTVLAEIGGPRYEVAFAPVKKLFRIKASTSGEFEAIRAGRSDKEMIRCRVPEVGFVFADGVGEPEYYVDVIGKAILIETPAIYLPLSVKALPPPSLSPKTEPAPAGADPVLMATLGLTASFPRRLGDIELSPNEARIVEVLYRRHQASRDALMMATADDCDEDDRDDKIVDVWIHKLRAKLEPLGIGIMTIRGSGWSMPLGSKRFIARIIGEEQP